MILDATTKSIELDLGEAHTTNAIPITVDYVDLTTTTTTPGCSDTASNGTTAVTIVSAPAASTQRKVNYISVYNADTVSHNVTIQLNNNSTLRSIIVVSLGSGQTLQYTDINGWGLLNEVGLYALLSGADFTGAVTHIAPTAATNPARLREVSLFPTVASATSPDIFGAAGATISIDNSTPVTTTDFTDCTSAQVGSVKRVIPTQNWTVTASANLTIDGNSSGNYTLLAGVACEVLATSPTTFQIYRPIEQVAPTNWTATLTCATPGNLSVSGVTQNCKYSVTGDVATIQFSWTGTVTHTTASGIVRLTGLPATIAPPTNQFSGSLSFGGITSAGYTQFSTQMNGDSDIYLSKSGSGVARANVAITDIPTGSTVNLSATFQIMLTPN